MMSFISEQDESILTILEAAKRMQFLKAERHTCDLFLKKLVNQNPYSCAEWASREAPEVAQVYLRAARESMGSFLRALRKKGANMSTLISDSRSTASPVDQYNQCRDATDEELIAGLKKLDESAFEELVRRYSNRLYRYATNRMFYPIEDPEELVNTAFYKLWDSSEKGYLRNVKKGKQLKGLLCHFTMKAILTVARDSKRIKRGGRFNEVNFEIYLERLSDGSQPADDSSALREAIRCIDSKLKELPRDRLTEIFKLRLQGCTQGEIADRIDMPIRTVRRRMQKIKALVVESESLDSVQ